MGGLLRLVLMAIVFLLPGGSLLLVAYAARGALRGKSWRGEPNQPVPPQLPH